MLGEQWVNGKFKHQNANKQNATPKNTSETLISELQELIIIKRIGYNAMNDQLKSFNCGKFKIFYLPFCGDNIYTVRQTDELNSDPQPDACYNVNICMDIS